jgi:hypothetical protein
MNSLQGQSQNLSNWCWNPQQQQRRIQAKIDGSLKLQQFHDRECCPRIPEKEAKTAHPEDDPHKTELKTSDIDQKYH